MRGRRFRARLRGLRQRLVQRHALLPLVLRLEQEALLHLRRHAAVRVLERTFHCRRG